jgi:hypothetical protein
MTRIYVSDKGDDNNDGLTRETAVYSWERATKLCDGNSQMDISEASQHSWRCRGRLLSPANRHKQVIGRWRL